MVLTKTKKTDEPRFENFMFDFFKKEGYFLASDGPTKQLQLSFMLMVATEVVFELMAVRGAELDVGGI